MQLRKENGKNLMWSTMKKIIISVVALFGIFNAKAQENTNNEQPKKLTFDEANLVSSYYKQDGNNSAVTGGIGSEKLTDVSNTIDVTMIKYDKKKKKNKFKKNFTFARKKN